MRTTIDIPDHLFRRAKAVASLAGKTLKVFVTEALEAQVEAAGGLGASPKRTRLPLVRSKAPGSVKLDEQTVAEVLEAEDIRVSG
ncbi:MAG: hypothetical protein QGG64_04315 [Candidatus Latescibacteria bacterium]|nr:hypothetical protein [Candidatus Latescibacterota bacterium]